MGPKPETQTATATVSPTGASVARGVGTNITLVVTATGGLTINALNIQRQWAGIAVTQVSTQTSGGTLTRVFTITPDASVPIGAHAVNFRPSISGYTGSGVPPTPNAVFTVTVTG